MIILMLTLVFQGCGLPSRYSVTIQNETTARLDDVQVSWDEYVVSAGIVLVGMEKSEEFPNAPFPKRAVVEWRAPNGRMHEFEVDVAAAVGRRSRWANVDLVLSISDEGTVEVSLKEGLA